MKFLTAIVVMLTIIGCNSPKSISSAESKQPLSDTVRIANDSIEYEVIIMEPGFNGWLASTARPRGYYSENFLESRNQQYVTEWNSRVLQPSRYSPTLYEMQINYDRQTRYGYEVNYLLYNYFIFFQLRHNQQLGTFVVRP